MSVESLIHSKEFEQKIPLEIERKFLPLFPERLLALRAESRPIEKYYLSHPSEPFSLRLRAILTDQNNFAYEATLKDTGQLGTDGITRMEVTVPVGEGLYQFYMSKEVPVVRKLRAEPLPGVSIDFYQDGDVQVESENPVSWQQFIAEQGDLFVDITGDHASSSEWKAHLMFRRANNGAEALVPENELRPDDIVRDILAHKEQGPLTIHIGGRSGSGKSTIVREVRTQLDTCGLRSTVISTDDYHRGTSWLQEYNAGEAWTHWDDPIVYDTATMARDLELLRTGQPIYARSIDWTVAEPVLTGTIEPTDVIIIEGIYAQAPEITKGSDLQYEMTTPLATCIGRRLLRDIAERPEFADPATSLGYMLSEAEPAYRAQVTARRGQS